MAEKIKVYVKRPDSDWYATNISNTLENFQRTVEGYIEVVGVPKNAVIVCNEKGRLLGLPFNTKIYNESFIGTIFVAGTDGEEFCDVPFSLKEWREILEALEALEDA